MHNTLRSLSGKELALIAFLLTDISYAPHLLPSLPSQLVTEMADGGMGSLQFSNPSSANRRFGNEIAELWLKDEDGIAVLATLIIDQNDQLYELDVWKVDFSPTTNLQVPFSC